MIDNPPNSSAVSEPTLEETRLLVIAMYDTMPEDKSGRHMSLHLFSVESSLPEGVSEEAKKAALLHDIKEDFGLTDEWFREQGFSQRVIDLCAVLTRGEGAGFEHFPKSKEPYPHYIDRVVASGDIEAIVIKDRDMGHNMSDERQRGLSFADSESQMRKYNAEKPKLEAAIQELNPEYQSQQALQSGRCR